MDQMMMFVIFLGIIIGLIGWSINFIKGWRFGVFFLILYMPFAGMITLMAYPSSFPALYKDIFIIIPLYISFFLGSIYKKQGGRKLSIPIIITATICILALLVLCQSFNPSTSWIVAAIGLKVWLFYLPMIYVGFSFARREKNIVTLLKIMVVTAWIPSFVGIGEFIASRIMGYRNVMVCLYGEAASAATQNFQVYTFGGTLFRIPATFSYWIQYSGYTLFMIAAAFMLSRIGDKARWRIFARISFFIFIVAALLSGAKVNFLYIPLMILLTAILSEQFKRSTLLIISLGVILGLIIIFGGIDVIELTNLMTRLFEKYTREVVFGGLQQAIREAPFGMGTGMNTGPARHAFSDPSVFNPIENYYAKASYELGLIGLVVVLVLFLEIIFIGLRTHRRIRHERLKSSSGAILAFCIVIVVGSLKGWQIDIDPINVYFWLFAGIQIGLGNTDYSLRNGIIQHGLNIDCNEGK